MFIIFFLFINDNFSLKKQKRIGIISCENNNNIGNNLVKFAMYTKLKEWNFDPTIIALTRYDNIYFIKKHVKLREINMTYKELKEKEFDFLIVNSDQTWVNVTPNYLLDYGFLKFAENWSIPKFVYGASYPLLNWQYSEQFNSIAGKLLKKFSGVSVREFTTVKLTQKYLGIKAGFVLDPTLLIDKKYYLNLIKGYKGKFNFEQDYICIYQLDKKHRVRKFINLSFLKLNLTLHYVNINENNYIEEFIKCINNSKAVITDSYHGTIFSIIFEKPFISFINSKRGNTRFISLQKTLRIKDRIVSPYANYNGKINLLKKKFVLNKIRFDIMKNISLNYLKKNLLIDKA